MPPDEEDGASETVSRERLDLNDAIRRVVDAEVEKAGQDLREEFDASIQSLRDEFNNDLREFERRLDALED